MIYIAKTTSRPVTLSAIAAFALVTFVGAVMLAPSKLLAKPKDIISKVYCECMCTVYQADGTKDFATKKFLAPGGDGKSCPNYEFTKCRIKKKGNYGLLSGCSSLVEKRSPNAGAFQGNQSLVPVQSKSRNPNAGTFQGNQPTVKQPNPNARTPSGGTFQGNQKVR